MIWNLFIAYVPPSDEVEMGGDIPRSVPTSTSLTSSSVMSDVAQSSAVADYSGELERQRQLAQYENQQRDIREKQQIELMRQQTASMLQVRQQAHREEATPAIEYVKNLTKIALNKLNKQSQEQQQMADQDERTKQRIKEQNIN